MDAPGFSTRGGRRSDPRRRDGRRQYCRIPRAGQGDASGGIPAAPRPYPAVLQRGIDGIDTHASAGSSPIPSRGGRQTDGEARRSGLHRHGTRRRVWRGRRVGGLGFRRKGYPETISSPLLSGTPIRNRTRTNAPSSPWVMSGSVPLNWRISFRIMGHPLPRCSIRPISTM